MIIALIIAALLVLWFISAQRKLVSTEEKCGNAMSQIGVQQNSRWDAVSSLADITRSYNEHEYKTLSDVIAQRKTLSKSSSADDAAKQESLIASALGQIAVVVEQYPDIKANQNYAKLMDSLNDYENNVRMARMVYNDTVTKYNKMVRQLPDSIIASILKFNVKEYLAEPENKTDMPKLNI